MSESWERENLTLDQLVQIENYEIISNVHQRQGRGGRPALITNTEHFTVKNLCEDNAISVPYGVEIVWGLLTPKKVTSTSIVKKIAVAGIYSKPNSRMKSKLIDHISQTYHYLCSKYTSGLHFILAGDTNCLKLDNILNLSSSLKQVVKVKKRRYSTSFYNLLLM